MKVLVTPIPTGITMAPTILPSANVEVNAIWIVHYSTSPRVIWEIGAECSAK